MTEPCDAPWSDNPAYTCTKSKPCFHTHEHRVWDSTEADIKVLATWPNPATPPVVSKQASGKRTKKFTEAVQGTKPEVRVGGVAVKERDPGLSAEIAAGIATADENADEEWKAQAMLAVRWCAEQYDEFLVQAVWDRLAATTGATTHNPAAMGPRMLAGVREGWIENSGEVRMLHEIGHRKTYVVVWRSLLR